VDSFDFSSYTPLLRGYAAACVVSVGLAVGLNQGLRRCNVSPRVRSVLQSIVPYTAVASAGVANVGLMRLGELDTGVPIYSPYGEYMGNSKEAAKTAILQTAISRAVLPIPLLALPPPILAILFRIPLLASNKLIKTATEISVITLAVAFGLPMAIALFPQEAKLNIGDVEEELRHFKDSQEREIMHIIFNKGL